MDLGSIIKRYRQERKMSMDSFSILSGLSKSYISMLEKNINSSTGKPIAPTIDAISKVAKAMNVNVDDLFVMIGENEISLTKDNKTSSSPKIIFNDYFPLHYYSNLSAGLTDEIIEDEDAVVYVPIRFQSMKDRLTAFKINGESMNKTIPHESIVIVERCERQQIKDGEIVACLIDGLATIKRIYIYDDYLMLMPDSYDKTFAPIKVDETCETRVIGKVIWFMNPDDVIKYVNRNG